jgi:hypothetical protein
MTPIPFPDLPVSKLTKDTQFWYVELEYVLRGQKSILMKTPNAAALTNDVFG